MKDGRRSRSGSGPLKSSLDRQCRYPPLQSPQEPALSVAEGMGHPSVRNMDTEIRNLGHPPSVEQGGDENVVSMASTPALEKAKDGASLFLVVQAKSNLVERCVLITKIKTEGRAGHPPRRDGAPICRNMDTEIRSLGHPPMISSLLYVPSS